MHVLSARRASCRERETPSGCVGGWQRSLCVCVCWRTQMLIVPPLNLGGKGKQGVGGGTDKWWVTSQLHPEHYAGRRPKKVDHGHSCLPQPSLHADVRRRLLQPPPLTATPRRPRRHGTDGGCNKIAVCIDRRLCALPKGLRSDSGERGAR